MPGKDLHDQSAHYQLRYYAHALKALADLMDKLESPNTARKLRNTSLSCEGWAIMVRTEQIPASTAQTLIDAAQLMMIDIARIFRKYEVPWPFRYTAKGKLPPTKNAP